MQAVESTQEIYVPEVNKIATKRINPWCDHAAHQLKSNRRAAEKKWLKIKTQKKKKKPKKGTHKSIRHTRPICKIMKRNT